MGFLRKGGRIAKISLPRPFTEAHLPSEFPSRFALSPGAWFDRIGWLGTELQSAKIDLESALRHAFHLLQLAPGPIDDMLGISISETQFEGWLEDGEWDVAARSLVANHLPISISKPDGHYVVRVEGLWFDASAERSAKSSPRAILEAWLACIDDIRAKASASFFTHRGQGQQESRSARRLPSNLH